MCFEVQVIPRYRLIQIYLHYTIYRERVLVLASKNPQGNKMDATSPWQCKRFTKLHGFLVFYIFQGGNLRRANANKYLVLTLPH